MPGGFGDGNGGGGDGGGEDGGGIGGPTVAGTLVNDKALASTPIAAATTLGSAVWLLTAAAASVEAVEPVEITVISASTFERVLETGWMALVFTPS